LVWLIDRRMVIHYRLERSLDASLAGSVLGTDVGSMQLEFLSLAFYTLNASMAYRVCWIRSSCLGFGAESNVMPCISLTDL